MRGLTVRQPWAWAIVHGGKDVENRSRNIAGTYRGAVAIQAGKALDDSAILVPPRMSLPVDPFGIEGGLIRGAVIGVVDLVDVHNDTGWEPYGPQPCDCTSPWAEPGMWHLMLVNPRPLTLPIPWRGAQGLWTVPADLEAAIWEQVAT